MFWTPENPASTIVDITVLQEVGYNHGKTLMNGWIKGGLIDELFKDKHSDHFSKCNIHKVQVSTRVTPEKTGFYLLKVLTLWEIEWFHIQLLTFMYIFRKLKIFKRNKKKNE